MTELRHMLGKNNLALNFCREAVWATNCLLSRMVILIVLAWEPRLRSLLWIWLLRVLQCSHNE